MYLATLYPDIWDTLQDPAKRGYAVTLKAVVAKDVLFWTEVYIPRAVCWRFRLWR